MKAVDAIELEFGLTHHVSSVKIRILTLPLRAHCLQKYEHFLVGRNPFYVYREIQLTCTHMELKL